uniref:Uncharacterized protein n=1 Tax=Pristionchus pacificus TaxID=54126 RepID=A0A2A6BNI4_PRIPA|eukprot:PDM67376.1 hypothetical protein PRIPAC_48793 [Pristionchus pacificus]
MRPSESSARPATTRRGSRRGPDDVDAAAVATVPHMSLLCINSKSTDNFKGAAHNSRLLGAHRRSAESAPAAPGAPAEKDSLRWDDARGDANLRRPDCSAALA